MASLPGKVLTITTHGHTFLGMDSIYAIEAQFQSVSSEHALLTFINLHVYTQRFKTTSASRRHIWQIVYFYSLCEFKK